MNMAAKEIEGRATNSDFLIPIFTNQCRRPLHFQTRNSVQSKFEILNMVAKTLGFKNLKLWQRLNSFQELNYKFTTPADIFVSFI